jgi:hypothetical protein
MKPVNQSSRWRRPRRGRPALASMITVMRRAHRPAARDRRDHPGCSPWRRRIDACKPASRVRSLRPDRRGPRHRGWPRDDRWALLVARPWWCRRDRNRRSDVRIAGHDHHPARLLHRRVVNRPGRRPAHFGDQAAPGDRQRVAARDLGRGVDRVRSPDRRSPRRRRARPSLGDRLLRDLLRGSRSSPSGSGCGVWKRAARRCARWVPRPLPNPVHSCPAQQRPGRMPLNRLRARTTGR